MKLLKLACSFILILLLSCSSESEKKHIDVSEIPVQKVAVFRLDQEMFEQDQARLKEKGEYFFKKYGVFFERYIQDILQLKDVNDPMYETNVRLFIQNSDMREVYGAIKNNFKDISWMEEELTEAFKHYKYYFPDSLIPKVTLFMSGLNYPIAASDSILGIGADMYLGSDCKFYPLIGIPLYKSSRMRKEYMVSDAIKSWLISEFEYITTNEDLLGQIIFNGKIMYATDMILPDEEDSVKLGFSQKQLTWCENNEAKIWAHVIENKLLFSNNEKDISKLINDGPFTPGLPRESPSRVGIWVGWQIVKSFMEKNPNVDLKKMMKMSAQEILEQSKYKPAA